jgi:hypothetical protein
MSLDVDAVRKRDLIAAEAAEGLRTYTALEGALVRALERAEGALLNAGEADAAERFAEASHFALRISAQSSSAATALENLAGEIETKFEPPPQEVDSSEEPPRGIKPVSSSEPPRESKPPPPGQEPPPELLRVDKAPTMSLRKALPEPRVKELRDARVPMNALDVPVLWERFVTPATLAASLRDVAQSLEAFGRAIEGWPNDLGGY